MQVAYTYFPHDIHVLLEGFSSVSMSLDPSSLRPQAESSKKRKHRSFVRQKRKAHVKTSCIRRNDLPTWTWLGLAHGRISVTRHSVSRRETPTWHGSKT